LSTDVYILPVGEDRLIFSPRRRLAALVNRSAAKEIARMAGNDPDDPVAAEDRDDPLAALREAISQAPVAPPSRIGPAQPCFLGLIVTRGCNMACAYCDFRSSNRDETMSPAILLGAIDGWVNHLRTIGQNHLELHFFGGEPFVVPDLVELAVHRTRARAADLGFSTHFEASTNGLLTERALGFVRDYFDAIVLSLDGDQQAHDRHRPVVGGQGSFDAVCRTARALAQSNVKLCVRCCVSNLNVARLPEIARQLREDFSPDTVTLEPMTRTSMSDQAGLAPPDPVEFARAFLQARRVLAQTGTQTVYSALFTEPRSTPCPVGCDAFLVSPAGSVRSCYLPKQQWVQRGLDLELGQVLKTGGLRIDPVVVERLRGLAADRLRCRRCFCRWGCAGGCLVVETPPGHGLDYTDFCSQTRLIQAADLLEGLGRHDLADRLVQNPAWVAALMDQHDDRLEEQRA
jgi:uncharacterized protein